MITVSDTVIRVVADRASAGDDPLGLGHEELDRSMRARSLVEAALDGMDRDTADRVAADMVHNLADRRRTIGNPQGLMPIDPLCAAIMQHLDIDPLAATWLSVLMGVVDIDDEDGVLVARTDGGLPPGDTGSRGSASVGDGGFWIQSGRLDVRGLPDTVTGLCAGRTLRSVVGHPVLDAYDLSIVEVEEWDGVTTLVTDHRPRPATIRELLALGPCGCR